MERSYAATRLTQSTSNATFRLIASSGQERVRETFGANRIDAETGENQRVVRFLSPGDVRNTALLLLERASGDDEIWIYLPALKKARRLARSNQKDAFVGTDLSYGDVFGLRPSEWEHRLLREDEIDGTPAWVVESLPRDEGIARTYGYGRRVTWVSQENDVALLAEYFDPEEQRLKTIRSRELKRVDSERNRWQPMRIEAENHQTGHRTVVTLSQLDATSEVDEGYFRVRYIEREE